MSYYPSNILFIETILVQFHYSNNDTMFYSSLFLYRNKARTFLDSMDLEGE
jgi:hypothetical protein